ncbi:MAG: acetate kinase [Micrococcales bacterium]|nr:MAG: acetate kinase [Micrococcales bacterium]PIE26827.1 MAG: acetate kinase [Micrococcales bacterium]
MTRAVLVINAGSSSVKYQLIDVDSGSSPARGLVERIGEGSGTLTHRIATADAERTFEASPDVPDHPSALRAAIGQFDRHGPDLAQAGIVAVGHRVVQGGEKFPDSTIITDEVIAAVEELTPLAPLHNPSCLQGIRAAQQVFSALPHVAVFDTAFHQTLPPRAYTYAVPAHWRDVHGVRRYGYHGTSHAYVSRRAAAMLGKDPSQVNVIVAHLGNGASVTAVAGGRSVDTSMGLTPLAGLVMGTRSGDVDPAVVAHITRVTGMDVEQVDAALNKQSGLLGLAGENDMRVLGQRAGDGDEAARLAREVYSYRIKAYIGQYYAAMGHLDAVAFTAGVGENDSWVRAESLSGLTELGIEVHPGRNRATEHGERVISTDASRVAVMVIPTNEELEIARQTVAVLDAS